MRRSGFYRWVEHVQFNTLTFGLSSEFPRFMDVTFDVIDSKQFVRPTSEATLSP